jgi:hypothetical protein
MAILITLSDAPVCIADFGRIVDPAQISMNAAGTPGMQRYRLQLIPRIGGQDSQNPDLLRPGRFRAHPANSHFPTIPTVLTGKPVNLWSSAGVNEFNHTAAHSVHQGSDFYFYSLTIFAERSSPRSSQTTPFDIDSGCALYAANGPGAAFR